MKKTLSLFLFSVLIFSYSTSFGQYSDLYLQEKKQAYKEFLKNHEYKNRPHYTKEELKAIPKYDRPDLAKELNFLQTMDPATGTVPYNKLIQAHKTTENLMAQNKTAIPGITWTERGPDNIGGRTRALMWDPNDGTGRTVFAGGVAGGLWKNTNITSGATQWTAIDDFWDNLAITALAYDPSNTQIMYAGTGEGYYNIDAVYGGGIWKSTDGGSNWTRLSSTSSYTRITRIAVASNGDVYASTNGNGIIRSTNGGTSWSTVLSSSVGGASTSRAGDLKIGADGTIYAGMGIMFATDGIYSSTNGTTWTKLNTGSNGFPTSDIQRLEIACAPSNSNVVYVIAHDGGSDVKGIYKTTNKGSTWSSLNLPNDADGGVSPDFTRSQAWYDLSIAVDPNDEDNVFVGGIDLFKSTDGGSNWTQVSHWYGGFGFQEVHADQHAAVFKPGSSTEIIFGHDGGVSYSSNATAGTPTISSRNNGYNVTQFYAGAINGTSGSNNMIAGSQDNGTHKFTSAGINSTTEVTGGDGAFCHIDQSNGNRQLSAYVRNNIYVTTNNWSNSSTLFSSNDGLFINPSDYDDKEDIFYSGYADGSDIRLRRIANPFGSDVQGTIVIASGSDDVSHVNCSQLSSAGNSTVFVGTDGGDVYKITNAQSGSPTITNIGSGLPSGNISCVAIGATEQQLVVTLSNYNTVSVWETTNGGSTWTNKEGNLPNMPVRWAMYNPLDFTQVFLATEVGVWSTADLTAGSVDWAPTNTGLANCRTDMLQYRSSDKTILAATHGRGLYTTTLPSASAPVAGFSGSPTTICSGDTVIFTDASTNTPTSWSWSFNPTTVTYVNGTNSSSQNPNVRFNAAGTYTVTLNATNASGSDQEIKSNYITVNDVPGNAGSITGNTTVCNNETGVSYSISSVSGATSYNWTVPSGASVASGQGTTSITVNFGTTSGNVSVTPVNSCGNGGNNSVAVTVSACGSAPVADFSGSPTTICEGSTVSFTDLSTNTPTGWSWSFPGGSPSVSTSQNPTVTYSSAGTYTVTLTASNTFGSDPETKTGYITVNACGTTKLRSQDCGITLPDYLTYITCDWVPGATEYEYEFVNAGLGYNQTYVRYGHTYRFVYLSNVPGIQNGTTYDVRVRAKVGGIFGSYGTVCQVTTPGTSITTQLRSSDCGIAMSSYNNYIICDYVSNATEYEYEFVNAGLGYNQTVVRTNPIYRFVYVHQVPGIQNNTTYDVRVRAKIGGVYTSFGAVCQITTPAGLTTKLRDNDCGSTMVSYSNYITCDYVSGATEYEYEFVNTGLSYNQTMLRTNPTYRFLYVNNVPGIQLGTTYDVRVRAKVGGAFTAYGPICQLTTPATLRTASVEESKNQDIISTIDKSNVEMIIYPNPNQGDFIYLELNGLQSTTELIVTDVSGKVIQQKVLNTDSENYNSTIRFNEKLNSGFYIITVVSGDQKITKKLIVR